MMSSSKVETLEPTTSFGSRIVLGLIRLYQLTLSPFIGRQCRFYPSCSHYAQEAVERHGVFTGGQLAVRRLCRCHPFNDGGVDLVPESMPSKNKATPQSRTEEL